LQDPKDWVSIEEVSGLLTISKTLDREIMAPRNDMYNITVMAIDQGNKSINLVFYKIIEEYIVIILMVNKYYGKYTDFLNITSRLVFLLS
jgi:hypothetical protein